MSLTNPLVSNFNFMQLSQVPNKAIRDKLFFLVSLISISSVFYCAFLWGLRLREICALKWEDIDMISRTLHVNRTAQRLPVDTVHTSGSSQNNHTATRKTSLYIDSPKTSNSPREILGHSNVNIILNRYVHPNLETKRSAINSIVIP